MSVLAGLELLGLLVVAGLIILGALVGRERYRARSSPGVRPTPEIFIDPETGRRTRVWYDSSSGAREYRPE